VFLFGCSSPPQSPPETRAADEAAIRQADIEWAKTGETRDLDAMMTVYTEDAVVLAQDMALVTGKAEIRQALDKLYATPGISVRWGPVHVEVARSGEIGYVRGLVEVKTIDSKGVSLTHKGKSIEVWKKQADGTWKCAVDMFNFDGSPTAESTSTKTRTP
jgi:ketosteroid isomerase-like protein